MTTSNKRSQGAILFNKNFVRAQAQRKAQRARRDAVEAEALAELESENRQDARELKQRREAQARRAEPLEVQHKRLDSTMASLKIAGENYVREADAEAEARRYREDAPYRRAREEQAEQMRAVDVMNTQHKAQQQTQLDEARRLAAIKAHREGWNAGF